MHMPTGLQRRTQFKRLLYKTDNSALYIGAYMYILFLIFLYFYIFFIFFLLFIFYCDLYSMAFGLSGMPLKWRWLLYLNIELFKM